MNFKKFLLLLILPIFLFCFFPNEILYGYEIFVHRPYNEKKPLFPNGKLTLHGEFFGQLQLPSDFIRPAVQSCQAPEFDALPSGCLGKCEQQTGDDLYEGEA